MPDEQARFLSCRPDQRLWLSIVIRNVGFDIARGEIVALLGKNGMGKTTLLRAIMGYLRKQAGRVLAGGRDISALRPIASRASVSAMSRRNRRCFRT